jgi:hypothetical protein
MSFGEDIIKKGVIFSPEMRSASCRERTEIQCFHRSIDE